MVVGNSPSGALPTSVSPAAAIFQSEPYGVPCASETYQNLPSGETVTLWGPSTSAGMMPTGTTLTVRSAVPSQASWVTMSPDSLVTRMRKSGPCWTAARPLASAASARIEEKSFTGAEKIEPPPGGLKPPSGRQSWQGSAKLVLRVCHPGKRGAPPIGTGVATRARRGRGASSGFRLAKGGEWYVPDHAQHHEGSGAGRLLQPAVPGWADYGLGAAGGHLRAGRRHQNHGRGPGREARGRADFARRERDRKSTRLNSSHLVISYAVFCLKKKKENRH